MRLLATLLLLLLSTTLYCQIYEPSPCDCCGNKALKNLTKGLKVDELYVHACGIGKAHYLSTSFLKPAGKAPVNPTKDPNYKPANDEDAVGAEENFNINFDKWSCKYAASMLSDGDTKTAWVEGVEGYGAGELVIAPAIDLNSSVEIFAGYGKSEALRLANSRPKNINVHVIRLKTKQGGASQCGTQYENLIKVVSRQVLLQDVGGFQKLIIPPFKREKYKSENQDWDYTYWLMIEIVDVYPGTKYKDTCISEIRNFQQSP
jgi:hypothetical protein